MNIDEAIKKIKIKLKQTESFLNRLKKRNEACYVEDLPLYMHWTEEDKQATEILFNEYNNLKQIEEAHRIENGKLREEITYSTKITPNQYKQLIKKGRQEIEDKIKQKYLELAYEQNEGKNIVENRYKMEVLDEIGDIYEIQ